MVPAECFLSYMIRLEETIMITLMHLPVRRGNAPLRIAHGHFATNHSHINYFVDITYQKTRLSEAMDSAQQLVANFVNDTPVDTILCLDGTAGKNAFFYISIHCAQNARKSCGHS